MFGYAIKYYYRFHMPIDIHLCMNMNIDSKYLVMSSWVTKYLHQIKARLEDKNKIENTHCAVIELGVACTASHSSIYFNLKQHLLNRI